MMGEEGGEQRARGGEYTSGAGPGSASWQGSDAKRDKKRAGCKICNLGLPETPLRILALIPFRASEP